MNPSADNLHRKTVLLGGRFSPITLNWEDEEFAVTPKTETDLLIEKMFEAALKEMFSQLAKKYDRDLVFHTWVNFVKKEIRPIPPDLQWNKGMTLAEALRSLETYFQSIEESIKKSPNREKNRKPEPKPFCSFKRLFPAFSAAWEKEFAPFLRMSRKTGLLP